VATVSSSKLIIDIIVQMGQNGLKDGIIEEVIKCIF